MNGGTTQELSPEWMPASSMCSMMPPMTTAPVGVGHRVDVELERVLEEPIDEHRPVVRDVDGAGHVAIERAGVEHDRHAAAAEHVRRPDDHRIADALGHLARFLARHRGAARRLRDAEVPQQLREPLAVFGQVDRVGRRAEDLHARLLQRQRQLERRLAAELHDARRPRRRRCARAR